MILGTEKAKAWASGFYYGWWVLVALMFTQVLTASFTMQSFGAYLTVMQAEFGWSKTAFAAALSIQQAGGGILGPLQGFLIQRFGGRMMVRIGIIIFAVALMLFSQVTSLQTFYMVFILISIGASFCGFLTLNSVAVQWFQRRRSLALALMQTGVSLGGLMVPLVAWSLVANGWRFTAFISGLLVLCIGIPLSFLIGNKPEDYDLLPDGVKKEDAALGTAPAEQHSLSAKQALKTRAFWLISVGHALALTVVFAVLTHLIAHLTEDLGFSLGLAATMMTVLTTMSISGQLLGGFLGDRLNKRFLAIGAMIGHAVALIILAYGQTLTLVLMFCVIHGLSWGIRGPIMQALRADYFGRRSFAQILGFSNVIVTLGTISGPVLAGLFADANGNYTLAFIVLAGLSLLGACVFVFATPPKKVLAS